MKILCEWYSESSCPSRGQQLLWPHPGLICETSSVGHGPSTVAVSAQHWEKSDILKIVFWGAHRDENNKLQRNISCISTCIVHHQET